MASHSTREVRRPSSLLKASTRPREAQETNGPRRMALSERMVAGESPLDHARGDPERARHSRRVEGSKGQTPAPGGTEPCFVYILLCSDGTFYVGCTTDVTERARIHNEGHGAEYTAARRPVRVVYAERHESWSAARKRESQIKRWTRAKKQALIDVDGRCLRVLAKRRT